MFTMTATARRVARQVTAHPRVGTTSGLRIAAQGSGREALGVGVVPAPAPDDEVVERDGARVFLDPEAVGRVRGRLLDAFTEDGGRVHFVVRGAR